jgi:hypothetical protein
MKSTLLFKLLLCCSAIGLISNACLAENGENEKNQEAPFFI